jgi:hypothetical protein
MIASALEEGHQRTLWKEKQHLNLCPPCFNFSDEDEDLTIRITTDGNMEHASLKRHTLLDFEIFEPKLFVDYGRIMFHLATSANYRVNTIIP